MSTFFRHRALSLAQLVLLGTGLWVALRQPGRWTHLSEDLRLFDSAAAAPGEGDRLTTDTRTLVGILEVKEKIVQAVIGGRLTLWKAAARFRAADRRRPPHLPLRLDHLPGQTEEERLCRGVLLWVEEEARDRPGGAALVARLQADLQERLDCDRPICLADPPEDWEQALPSALPGRSRSAAAPAR